jgi:ABC-type transport system involved in cytochrome bd biosynthesis fused ATPase/permease subunit
LSGVDIEIEELIYKQIKKYSKENAVFLITHNLTNLAKTDYLYIMRNGKIEEEGKPEILLQNGSPFGLLWKRQNISLIEKGILANG